MLVQINTDSSIKGDEASAEGYRQVVESALDRFSDRITRVEVHLSDQNGPKGGEDDKRCVMEARLEGQQPTAVTCQAASLEEAVAGAADKLARVIDSTLGRLRDS
jgi:hypothetical protein